MSAHTKPPKVSRQRSAHETADVVLIWHDDLVHIAGSTVTTAEDHERRAAVAHASAMRYHLAATAEESDDIALMWLSLVGRYAMVARVHRARARELRS